MNQLTELLKSQNSKSSSDNENNSLVDGRADWALKLQDLDVQLEYCVLGSFFKLRCEIWVLLSEILLKKNKPMLALDCCRKVLISLHGVLIF